jgi:hypothetical protein
MMAFDEGYRIPVTVGEERASENSAVTEVSQIERHTIEATCAPSIGGLYSNIRIPIGGAPYSGTVTSKARY